MQSDWPGWDRRWGKTDLGEVEDAVSLHRLHGVDRPPEGVYLLVLVTHKDPRLPLLQDDVQQCWKRWELTYIPGLTLRQHGNTHITHNSSTIIGTLTRVTQGFVLKSLRAIYKYSFIHLMEAEKKGKNIAAHRFRFIQIQAHSNKRIKYTQSHTVTAHKATWSKAHTVTKNNKQERNKSHSTAK